MTPLLPLSGVEKKLMMTDHQFCQGLAHILTLSPSSLMSSGVPADMIYFLILVSGKTKEFLLSPNDSASDIAKHVYDNWPMDWEEERVSSPNIPCLIYQGRFLHGNVTIGALKLPFGKITVMHLVAKETLPEPNSQGQRNRGKTRESNCCIIL
ncbi:ubiquitin-like protein 3 isoform X1 [Rousettus aegyptiacus]|uniref:ubiquitin-like protein 3 isoform X1 n=1 Tax=Rousettus aegyptiacus TaxID=9407 RepID=UPI00168D3F6D|nr:ubiquitin-like protein 3 isoform X1 [Rousettus aegyptiacus]XP_036085622.1 ubiquitin-like protein 3 isoform X1 [Rousettus aegyptiacus]XP_036085623.1 ubiquitin-like protein 3 isoform X1 [Rousettus aegyptiacus]XP_036085624.1 ubiquitin-like protein 3 isoform X1 [Rousettus aegyptiacus]